MDGVLRRQAAACNQPLVLSRSRSSLPVLKKGTRFSFTSTASPVRGLRPDAGVAGLGRERAEAAQLHPVAVLQRIDDLVEHRVDDALDVAVIEVRIFSAIFWTSST